MITSTVGPGGWKGEQGVGVSGVSLAWWDAEVLGANVYSYAL